MPFFDTPSAESSSRCAHGISMHERCESCHADSVTESSSRDDTRIHDEVLGVDHHEAESLSLARSAIRNLRRAFGFSEKSVPEVANTSLYDSNSDTCPHDAMRSSCSVCISESRKADVMFRDIARQATDRYLFGKVRNVDDALLDIERVRVETAHLDRGEFSGDNELSYLEGTFLHDAAHTTYASFSRHIRRMMKGVSALNVDRAAYEDAYASWEDKDLFEDYEKRALAAYERIDSHGFVIDGLGRSKNLSLSTDDALLQALDIRWAMASRIRDPKERSSAYADLRTRTDALSERFRGGVRDEHRVIAMLRHRFEQVGIDHAVTVNHALPREDLNAMYKEDVYIMAPDGKHPVQIKSWAEDSNIAEWQEQKRKAEEANIRAISVSNSHIILRNDKIRTAWESYTQGKTRGISDIMLTLADGLHGDAKEAVLRASEGKRKKTVEQKEGGKGRKATESAVGKALTVPILSALGFLPSGITDAGRVVSAKAEAVTYLREIGITTNELSILIASKGKDGSLDRFRLDSRDDERLAG